MNSVGRLSIPVSAVLWHQEKIICSVMLELVLLRVKKLEINSTAVNYTFHLK